MTRSGAWESFSELSHKKLQVIVIFSANAQEIQSISLSCTASIQGWILENQKLEKSLENQENQESPILNQTAEFMDKHAFCSGETYLNSDIPLVCLLMLNSYICLVLV